MNYLEARARADAFAGDLARFDLLMISCFSGLILTDFICIDRKMAYIH